MTAYPPANILSIEPIGAPVSTGAKPARGPNRHRLKAIARHLPSALFAIIFGGLLIGLALPRLFVDVAVFANDGRADRLTTATGAELAAETRARRGALRVMQTGRGWSALGEIYIERARRLVHDPETYDVFLDRAIDALRRGVARAPAQPVAWTLLAQAMLARHGPRMEIGPPLRMAIRTAPHRERLLLPRIDIGLLAWDALNGELHRLVAGQIALAVDRVPIQLARLVRKRYALGQVRRLLAADPTRLRRFDTAYLSLD